jgi:hypothetical protein
MSKSMADKILKEMYDIFPIDYVPGERAPVPQVNANPNKFENIFNLNLNLDSVASPFAAASSSSTPVPLLTRKGFLHVATIEVLRDPSSRWWSLSLLLKKYDLSQYKGWGDLPRNVLPDRPDQRMVQRLADSATMVQAKLRQDVLEKQMGHYNNMIQNIGSWQTASGRFGQIGRSI